MTCAQHFRLSQDSDGRAVLLRRDDGNAALWLHQLPTGGICLDDWNTCPQVPIGRRDVERATTEWREAVDWDGKSYNYSDDE